MEGVIASLELTEDLPTLQRQDAELAPIFTYLETGILPTEENVARRLALTATQYTVEDNVLYRVEADGSLRVIPPRCQHEQLLHTVVSSAFI